MFAGAMLASLMFQLAAPAARAAVNVSRGGDENPMREVARSVVWGGLAGLTVGAAIAVATEGSDGDGEAVRWGFAGGTFVGLGYGLWWVSRRPQPSALLEVRDGRLLAHAALPEPDADGSLRLRLARVTF
jgi:hypothetical protein